jgi:hypothetical protein
MSTGGFRERNFDGDWRLSVGFFGQDGGSYFWNPEKEQWVRSETPFRQAANPPREPPAEPTA